MTSFIGFVVLVIATEKDQKELEATFEKGQALARASSKCTTKAQCTYEVIGNDCGGPIGFIIYSTTNANRVQKIKRLISKASVLARSIVEEKKRNNIPIACATLMAGTLECRNRKCVFV